VASEEIERRLVAILMADVAGYSRLIGIDDEGTLAQLNAHHAELVEPKIKEHRGRIVRTTGDGLLVLFVSAVDALRCAVEIQRAMAKRNSEIAADRRIEFRMGVNVGDIVEGASIHGDGINVAARLEALAKPGNICVSSRVQEDAQASLSRLGIAFEDIGQHQLKNIQRAVHIYRVLLDQGDAKTRPPLSIPDKPSIAVLPFQNMSGDPEQEYFADGMVEEIITGLSRFRWLFVIARNSSFTYKDRAVDVKQVGRELGVRYLLEGSVRKSANRIRIAGQLIDASSGVHLWADRFDGALEDVFELQDQVTASVVGAIAPRLQRAEIDRASRKPTESLDAYDLLQRGFANVYKWTREGNEEGLRLFYKAVELDPDFSAAYAAAARCFSRRKAFGWVIDREQEVAEARRLALRAVQLGKDDATVLYSAGYVLAYVARELDDGAAFLDRALSLNPNLAMGWSASGWVKVYLGEPDRAVERFAHAMRLSPVDPVLFGMQQGTAYAHFFAGRYDEAVSWAKMALREVPSSHPALRIAAASCALAGRGEEAKGMVARLLEIDPVLRTSNLQNVLGPYRQPEHPAKYTDALRKAGLPE
jgi:TolB-like protein/class 3 adenylate cyclase/Tfp pilus assembly protein PilF